MSTYGVNSGSDPPIEDTSKTTTISYKAASLPSPTASIQSLSASPSSNVSKGTTITVSLTLKNSGDRNGTLWGRLKNGAGNIKGPSKDTSGLSTGSTTTLSWDITMPGHDLTIEAEAGHYELVCCETTQGGVIVHGIMTKELCQKTGTIVDDSQCV